MVIRRRVAKIASLAFVLGILIAGTRAIVQYQPPGKFDATRQGMCDFHNGIYFPTFAILQGVSPYSQAYADDFPVERPIPFFSPLILLVHSPLAVMPLRLAELVYFAIQIALIISISMLVCRALQERFESRLDEVPKFRKLKWRDILSTGWLRTFRWDWVMVTSALIVLSRGGHITLFDGYFTFELVLACFVAIHFADRRPWVSAFALAIVSAKPTFILPLGFLLLFRGQWKSILLGAGLSIVGALIPMLWLGWQVSDTDLLQGCQQVIADISASQDIHRATEDELPLYSWTRIDSLAFVAKWLAIAPDEATHLIVMMFMLCPSVYLLWLRGRHHADDGLTGQTGVIIILTSLVSIYHQSYDALLLIPSIIGLSLEALGADQTRTPRERFKRLLIAGFFLVPLFNFLSTRTVLGDHGATDWLTKAITSTNAICLTAALAVLWIWQFRQARSKSGAYAKIA